MKLKEQMLNCQEEYQEGLDKGIDICLNMINKSLGTNYQSFGVALANIEQMKYKIDSNTDWK